MTVQQQDETDVETAVRIRRIREAFADARTEAGIDDAEEEFALFTNWDNWLKV